MESISEMLKGRLERVRVPSVYYDLNLNEDFGEVGKQVLQWLIETEEKGFPLHNMLLEGDLGEQLGHSIIKSYCVAGFANAYSITLEDIVAARNYKINQKDMSMVHRTEDFLIGLNNNPKVVFISDFVSHVEPHDKINMNFRMYGDRDYQMLSSFIKDRFADTNLTTILHSVDDVITHSWGRKVTNVVLDTEKCMFLKVNKGDI